MMGLGEYLSMLGVERSTHCLQGECDTPEMVGVRGRGAEPLAGGNQGYLYDWGTKEAPRLTARRVEACQSGDMECRQDVRHVTANRSPTSRATPLALSHITRNVARHM